MRHTRLSLLLPLLLWLLASAHAFASQPPLLAVTGFAQDGVEYEPYYSLDTYQNNARSRLSGHYWSIKYSRSEEGPDRDAFFATLVELNPGLALLKEYGDSRYFSLDAAGQHYWFIVSFHRRWYEVTALEAAPYSKILTLGGDEPHSYSRRAKARSLESPLLPHIDGFDIERSAYALAGTLSLSYHDKVMRQRRDIDGRFWSVEYKATGHDGLNQRYQLIHNYRDELLRLGGVVLEEDGNSLVFTLAAVDGDIWGTATAYSNSLDLQLVKAAASAEVPVVGAK